MPHTVAAEPLGARVALIGSLETRLPALRAHVAGKIGPQWSAWLTPDDVVQDTLIDAFRRINSFVPADEHALDAWLYRIAEHKVIDAVRWLSARPDLSRRLQHGPDPSVTLLHSLFAASASAPSLSLRAEEAASAVKTALTCLPDEYRFVIEEFDLAGRSMDAVAQSLNRTRGAAYLLRKRALERLREVLTDNLSCFNTSA
jgi:RNA polymerase sigma factor (sigma-70 family)